MKADDIDVGKILDNSLGRTEQGADLKAWTFTLDDPPYVFFLNDEALEFVVIPTELSEWGSHETR